MDKKQTFQNDPARFFLDQGKFLSVQERQSAIDFSQSIFDNEKCSVCLKNYDLGIRAPRILIHCGHTVCTSCLYLFFKNEKVNCPLCSKVIKQLRVIEILPLNHNIFTKLSLKLQKSEIDPINSCLRLPEEIIRELAEKEEVDIPICEYHEMRYKHFACIQHSLLLCRMCISEELHPCSSNIIDIYFLRPEAQIHLLSKLA